LLRWARDFIWGNLDQGVSHFRKAINLGSSPGPGFDRSLIQFVTNQLMICEAEFDTPTQTTLTRLTKFMVDHNQAALARQLRANYWKNRAIQNFNSQKSSRLIPFMINAIAADPTYLMNRGALSMLYRSTISRLKDISWKQDS
jgi:hypothetical protein